MKRVRRYCTLTALLSMGLMLCPPLAVADRSATVTVKVRVLAQPCSINDGKPINVDFTDVLTTEVDSGKYRQPVPYTLDCPGASAMTQVKIQIVGESSFGSSVLRTSSNGLGIVLQNGPNEVPMLNKSIMALVGYPISIEAKLVKQPGVSLKGGPFTAGATMKVGYP